MPEGRGAQFIAESRAKKADRGNWWEPSTYAWVFLLALNLGCMPVLYALRSVTGAVALLLCCLIAMGYLWHSFGGYDRPTGGARMFFWLFALVAAIRTVRATHLF
jgi:hypothetical protein